MIRRLLVIAALGVLLSGCYMVPMALIGPATSGFKTASIIQSGITTSASYIVQKTTGKTIGEHAFDAVFSDDIEAILKQAYFPKKNQTKLIKPGLKSIQVHKD